MPHILNKSHQQQDIHWMTVALDLAAKAQGKTSPNPMVGCVLVCNDTVVGKGFHEKAGGPHAEINALKNAGDSSLPKETTAYVTLEPCSHFGRTGPCTKALIAAGVMRVVIATKDPFSKVNGRGIRQIRKAGINVTVGPCRKKALTLNNHYFHYISSGQPWVTVKMAQSLDGKIATHTGASQWITSAAARKIGHHLRSQHDAILVGIGTLLADNPRLTCRLPSHHRNPLRVILDSTAQTPQNALIFNSTKSPPPLIVVGSDAPDKSIGRLRAAGGEILTLPKMSNKNKGLSLPALLTYLGQQQIQSLLIEGGPTVLGSFFDCGLVNQVELFMAPTIIGGLGALSAVGGLGCAELANRIQLEQLKIALVGPDIHLSALVVK